MKDDWWTVVFMLTSKAKLVIWNDILYSAYSHNFTKEHSPKYFIEKVGNLLATVQDFPVWTGLGIIDIAAHFH